MGDDVVFIWLGSIAGGFQTGAWWNLSPYEAEADDRAAQVLQSLNGEGFETAEDGAAGCRHPTVTRMATLIVILFLYVIAGYVMVKDPSRHPPQRSQVTNALSLLLLLVAATVLALTGTIMFSAVVEPRRSPDAVEWYCCICLR